MTATMPKPPALPSAPLRHFKAGVTTNWKAIRVFDLDRGDLVSLVIEANTVEGWLIRVITDEKGRPVHDPVTGSRRFELLRGRYAILSPTSAR